MTTLAISDIRSNVHDAVRAYNAQAPEAERINKVSLFGSYAEERANEGSDVDLLVRFSTPVVSLIVLGRVLDLLERALPVSVDVVQDPVPADSLLQIYKVVPLYESI